MRKITSMIFDGKPVTHFGIDGGTVFDNDGPFIHATIVTEQLNLSFVYFDTFSNYIKNQGSTITGDVTVTFSDPEKLVDNISNLFEGLSVNRLDLTFFDLTNITNTTNMFLNTNISEGVCKSKREKDIFNNENTGISAPVFNIIDYRILYNEYESITLQKDNGLQQTYLDTKIPLSTDINYEISCYYSNPTTEWFHTGIIGGINRLGTLSRYGAWMYATEASGWKSQLRTNAGFDGATDVICPNTPSERELFTISTENILTEKKVNVFNTEATFPLVELDTVGNFFIGNISTVDQTDPETQFPLWSLTTDMTFVTVKFKTSDGVTFMNLVPVTPKENPTEIYMINTYTNELFEFVNGRLSLGAMINSFDEQYSIHEYVDLHGSGFIEQGMYLDSDITVFPTLTYEYEFTLINFDFATLPSYWITPLAFRNGEDVVSRIIDWMAPSYNKNSAYIQSSYGRYNNEISFTNGILRNDVKNVVSTRFIGQYRYLNVNGVDAARQNLISTFDEDVGNIYIFGHNWEVDPGKPRPYGSIPKGSVMRYSRFALKDMSSNPISNMITVKNKLTDKIYQFDTIRNRFFEIHNVVLSVGPSI